MTLVLLRHGESEWNALNLFTGWWDVDLSATGRAEAAHAGELLAAAGLLPDVLHTSVLTRAVHTASLALETSARSWIPVRRSWRLNERHYGDLQGKDKAQVLSEFGAEKFMLWRRSWDVPPPPISPDSPYDVSQDPRYAALDPAQVPRTECLADVVTRLDPYWSGPIAEDLANHRVVLVTAHGNSLRALIKDLDGISDDAIADLNVPTGNPLVYELDAQQRPTGPGRYLDPAAAAAGAAKVAAQGH